MIGKDIHGFGNAQDGTAYRLYDDDLGLDLWPHPGPVAGMHPDLHGTDGDDTFAGTDGDDHYLGLGGNDVISGAAGKDHLSGGDGDDVIDGGSGNDVITGGLGQDVIHGGDGKDGIKATSGDEGDKVYGGNGDDGLEASFASLYGGTGNDILAGEESLMKGGAGNDELIIGNPFAIDSHSHEVWGGAGSDYFLFRTPIGYIGGGSEEIHDLSNEDRVDLSHIDTNDQRSGDQLHFKIVDHFDGHAGEMTIKFDAQHDRTVIDLYTDTDKTPDGVIWTPGNHADFANFVL